LSESVGQVEIVGQVKSAGGGRDLPGHLDVFSTARKYGFPIEVLSQYGQTMNRYAMLLIE
jgi:hypothetical protein